MLQSRSGRYRFARRAGGGTLAAIAALLTSVAPISAQAAPPAEEDSVIEWNFQPVSAPRAVANPEERWAAPFAVESRGRPAERTPRPVVVLRDSVAARRVAAAQVAAGESAAEVRVQPAAGSGPGASGASGATRATSAAGADAAAGGEDEDAAGAEDEEAGSGAAEQPAVASAPARLAAPTGGGTAAAARARTHRVEYGETWYGIARQYQVSSARLAAANPDVDPERLRSGTVLRIPAAGSAPAAAAPSSSRPRTHTVARGDTLFGIARRYGVSAAAIRTANRLTDDVVRLGQTLVIPREEAAR